MAFFDERELVDLIRHELRVEDESGLTARTIAPAHRRSKFGGLPLNFRAAAADDDDDEDVNSSGYVIPLYEEPVHTRNIIESRVRSRTGDSTKDGDYDRVRSSTVDSDSLFVPAPAASYRTGVCEERISVVSRFVSENLASLRNPLNEFARFEAVGDKHSRKITIIFPSEVDGKSQSHEICVLPTAKVSQVIGFSLYKYFQLVGTEIGGSVDDYDLFMAEDSGEVDSDFPPLERARPIGELGFPVLALVRSARRAARRDGTHAVTVYFPSGLNYSVDVLNDELTLSWLCERAIELRQSSGSAPAVNIDQMMNINEYVIESVDGDQLSLDASIGSTACKEFVVIRKNSSRGGFHPRPRMSIFAQRPISMMPITPLPSSRPSGIFEFPPMLPPDPTSPLSPFGTREDSMISCFMVERLHRYKPKWTANLVLRWTILEITPLASESERRRSFLPANYQKNVRLPWENVCDAVLIEKERSKDTTYQLTLWWLSVLDESTLKSITEREVLNLKHIVKYYDALPWKSITIECRSREDAHEIHSQIHSVIVGRESPALQAWQFSSSGTRRPAASAELAISAEQDGDVTQVNGTPRKKGRLRQIARLSRILSPKVKS